jgi:hypothetical protein
MGAGGLTSLCVLNAKDVVRADGTRVHLAQFPTWKSEIVGLFWTLYTDSYVILLVPMFFASNLFYTYQFNGVNQAHYNIRTRALNNLLYWIAQIIGALVYGYSVDTAPFSRTVKAKISWVLLVVLTIAIWGGGYAWQKSVPDRVNEESPPLPAMDWATPGYGGPMFLYMAYGFYDAVWQSSVYW